MPSISKKEYYRLKKKAKQKKHRKIKTEKKKKKNPLVVVNQYNNPLPGAYSFTRNNPQQINPTQGQSQGQINPVFGARLTSIESRNNDVIRADLNKLENRLIAENNQKHKTKTLADMNSINTNSTFNTNSIDWRSTFKKDNIGDFTDELNFLTDEQYLENFKKKQNDFNSRESRTFNPRAYSSRMDKSETSLNPQFSGIAIPKRPSYEEFSEGYSQISDDTASYMTEGDIFTVPGDYDETGIPFGGNDDEVISRTEPIVRVVSRDFPEIQHPDRRIIQRTILPPISPVENEEMIDLYPIFKNPRNPRK
jgi:hypothetical protein